MAPISVFMIVTIKCLLVSFLLLLCFHNVATVCHQVNWTFSVLLYFTAFPALMSSCIEVIFESFNQHQRNETN